MNILILCGAFTKENENEVIRHAKRTVEFSANIFQKKLIDGFKNNGFNTTVVSAPFIGSYPNASDIKLFSGFETSGGDYNYVAFNNIWGIRNLSRASSLKHKLKALIKPAKNKELIVVYSPHTPFLEAAVYAKKRNPDIKICLVVPDLPQYMNLNAKKSFLYRFAKFFDIKKFNRLNKSVDSYVLLTEAMKDKIHIAEKPYCVAEGIAEESAVENICNKSQTEIAEDEKYIVYTGKTNEKFGVKKLTDEFCKTNNPQYRLVICGSGDTDEYIKSKVQGDKRIIATGQITPAEAAEWMKKADVLVNPRENNDEYTKYSFPSKTIEYLLSGKPVVGYLLDGMPEIYKKFIIDAGDKGLMPAIEKALNSDAKAIADRNALIKEYFKELSPRSLAKKIVDMNCQENLK